MEIIIGSTKPQGILFLVKKNTIQNFGIISCAVKKGKERILFFKKGKYILLRSVYKIRKTSFVFIKKYKNLKLEIEIELRVRR